jgi:hypothetical protein
MSRINILNISGEDPQSILIDKINYDFDQLLTSGGGPRGPKGPKGSTGLTGPQGIQGPIGNDGFKGSKWYSQITEPPINQQNPEKNPEIGDYWLSGAIDPINPFSFYVFAQNEWKYTGVSFQTGSLFSPYEKINDTETQKAIIHDEPSAQNYSLVISDHAVNGREDFVYTDPGLSFGINSDGGPKLLQGITSSKLKIATSPGGYNSSLLSFGRSDLDEQKKEDPVFSSLHNPSFEWSILEPPVGSNTSDWYDLDFKLPKGNLTIIVPSNQIKNVGLASYNVNFTSSNNIDIKSNRVLVNRTGLNNTFQNLGNNTYFVEGSEIRYEPKWQATNGNFIIGRPISTQGTKGIVISRNSSDTPKYLIIKSDSTTLYGGIGAEVQSGGGLVSKIDFRGETSSQNTNIDFATSNSSQQNNTRLTLDSEGDLTFKFGEITGSSRDVSVSIQTAAGTDQGANLILYPGSSASGSNSGGNIYILGGKGGLNNGKSGNVILNTGYTSPNGASLSNSIYFYTQPNGNSNLIGVSIGLDESLNQDASLVVSDTNNDIQGGDIIQLKTYSQRNNSTQHFFGFNPDGYLTRGLPYNQVLSNTSPGYQLSNDPYNLDYYAEGDWSSTFSLEIFDPIAVPEWGVNPGVTSSARYKLLKSRFTREGDLVNVDFMVKVDNFTGVGTTSLNNISGNNDFKGFMYISGLPYEPDFSRSLSTNVELANYRRPGMPYYSLLGKNIIANVSGSSSDFPVGTIIPWASPSTNIPSGWFLCNGQELNISQWPELFSLLQTTYGSTTSTSRFKIPDLSGLFIRGSGGLASPMGQIQSDTFKAHSHTFSRTFLNSSAPVWTCFLGICSWVPFAGSQIVNRMGNDGDQTRETAKFGQNPNETRPINTAMSHIIFAGKPGVSVANQIVSMSSSFVQHNSTETRLYLYTGGGNLSVQNIPKGDGNLADTYIGGSFKYFTQSQVSYISGACNAPTNLAIISTTGNIRITFNKGTGNPSSITLESSADNGSTWTTVGQVGPVSPATFTSPMPFVQTRFRLYQTCASGNSGYSNVVTYNPPACTAASAPVVFGVSGQPGRVEVRWVQTPIPTSTIRVTWRKQGTIWPTSNASNGEYGIITVPFNTSPVYIPSSSTLLPSQGIYEFKINYDCGGGVFSPDSPISTYNYVITQLQNITGTMEELPYDQNATAFRINIIFSSATPCSFSLPLSGNAVYFSQGFGLVSLNFQTTVTIPSNVTSHTAILSGVSYSDGAYINFINNVNTTICSNRNLQLTFI